jgi:hypothetical protein
MGATVVATGVTVLAESLETDVALLGATVAEPELPESVFELVGEADEPVSTELGVGSLFASLTAQLARAIVSAASIIIGTVNVTNRELDNRFVHELKVSKPPSITQPALMQYSFLL